MRERILKRRGSSLYKTSEYNDIRLIIHEINYSEQEKKTVIDLFEKVKFYYENLGSTQSYYYIASRVKELLLNYSGYCSLVPQNIRNWYIHKDKNNK